MRFIYGKQNRENFGCAQSSVFADKRTRGYANATSLFLVARCYQGFLNTAYKTPNE